MPELFAGRFSGNVSANGAMLEAFEQPERLGLRWSIQDYGLSRIEVTVKAKSRLDQYDRLNSHFGGINNQVQRIGVFDNLVYNCVTGRIVGIRPEGTHHVTYITRGPKWRFYDNYGPTTVAASTATTSTQLKNFLNDDMTTGVLSGDVSNVDETSTQLGGWQPPQKIGMRPGDFVDFAIQAGNSSGQLWDFYCIDEPMRYGNIQAYTPYFKNRATRTAVNWRVSINDLTRLDLERGIHDFRSVAVIWYGTYSGTATGGSSTQLQDSGASFLNGRFSPGDEVRNITDGSVARIRDIASNTTINLTTLSDGSSNSFSGGGDIYSIKADKLWLFEEEGNATFNHLNRYIAEHRPELNSTQADQYAKAVHDFYSTPVQSAAFTVTAPYVRDGSGARRPLWAPIFEGGGLIQITDLYPAAAVSLNQATNNLDTFFITALDYDYTSHQLRVAVNVPDSRLDARLAAQGILGSAGIARGGLR